MNINKMMVVNFMLIIKWKILTDYQAKYNKDMIYASILDLVWSEQV